MVDRLIQQALLQVLQPLIDPTFSEHSYGFRPGRSAHQAVQAARQYVEQGRRVVVDVEPRVLAVLDWELATLGHPLADFAYHCMTWRVSPEEFRGLKGHALDALGIPAEDAYVRAYCERTGRTALPDWDYYLAFNMFRMAAILQGILARAQQGSAASAQAEETGRRARPMAEAGWRQVQTTLR